jgi:hypothetical protein
LLTKSAENLRMNFTRSTPPEPPRRRRLPAIAVPERALTLGERARHALAEARSGPSVARLFHRLLALVFAIAWLSLGAQIDVLVGSRGLLPVAPFLAGSEASSASFTELPTFLRWTGGSDGALRAGIAAGLVLSLLALGGLRPRLCLGLSTFLYLGYAVTCRNFLGFQWDNLLLECGLLALFLPEDRPADLAHLLFRVLLFKLYWESGLAKWQSPLHDWQDGSAMRFYYETAPIPARLGHAFHALPAGVHQVESWLTLFFELVVPFAIFATRRLRLAAAAIFTVFQVVNIVTANYGFFSYLSLSLHVFLVSERDLLRARALIDRRSPIAHRVRLRARWLRIILARRSPLPALERRARAWIERVVIASERRRGVETWAMRAFAFAYLSLSFIEGAAFFGDAPELLVAISDVRSVVSPFRMVNKYHLFAAVTRERVEPELQTQEEGQEAWVAHDFAHKPGDPRRAPHLVAPHQPRVDFLLWFYGLGFRRGTPAYVSALLERVCHDPGAVRALFPGGLPERPGAARIAFFRYHFTTPEELAATGAWWRREWVGATPELLCK